MGSRTMIEGTGYAVRKGRVLIEGTGYDIRKGKTLLEGTGYTINLFPIEFSRVQVNGPYPPAGGFTFTFTETDSMLKGEMTGQATQASRYDRAFVGFLLYLQPNSSVSITWSANTGSSYSESEIRIPGDREPLYKTSYSFTDKVTDLTTSETGQVYVRANIGDTTSTDRWVSISRIAVAGVQVFPAT